jgi:Na+/H+ antiporter NhaD/arsenite permease-like protein
MSPTPAFVPPIVSVLPFAGLLLCIALAPLINAQWWHKHYAKVAAVTAATMGVYDALYLPQRLPHTLFDYAGFIALTGSLFVITGGIHLRGTLSGRPSTNVAFLILGALIANFIGTTGASMLLIRPLIRANRHRPTNKHTILFFIFIVSNVGGTLTPLGDPPLFLGFLQGVDFFWTLKLFPPWAFALGILTTTYYFLDRYYFVHERVEIPKKEQSLRVDGGLNAVFLAGVILTVLSFKHIKELFPQNLVAEIVQIALMSTMGFLSYQLTPKEHHSNNEFHWEPFKEVAVLFLAIFLSMIPVLVLLETRGTAFHVQQAHQIFWVSGLLSSFLDNAPTYLTFLSLAKTMPIHGTAILLTDGSRVSEIVLEALSLGCVFMGAMTYIGNGPNFMVRSIANRSGVKMPSFFGYMAWSVACLVPVFSLIHHFFLK